MRIFIFFVILLSGSAIVRAQEVTNPEPDKTPKKAGSFRKTTEDAQKSKELLPGGLKMTFDDGCGNPFAESQAYSYRYGKVLEITSDNKIIVKVLRSNNVWDDEYEKTADGVGRKLIKPQIIIASMVGIDENTNQTEIGKFLLDKVLDQQVTLIGNTKKDDGKKIDALIELTDDKEIGEINTYLLGTGTAKFKAFQLTNIVPIRTACQLEKVEAKAKNEKLGIWAK
jgi:hypothetical protein